MNTQANSLTTGKYIFDGSCKVNVIKENYDFFLYFTDDYKIKINDFKLKTGTINEYEIRYSINGKLKNGFLMKVN